VSATVRAPFVRLGWLPWLVTLAVVGLARGVLAAWRHPWIAAGVVALVLLRLAVVEHGVGVLAVPVALAVALLAWRRIGPVSYEAAVGRTVRSRWRRAWIYRREWQPALVVAGLEGRIEDRPPRLLGVDSSPDGDRVLVRMAPGQTVQDWQQQANRLAAVFGVRHVRARRAPRGRDRIVLHARRHVAPIAVDVPELVADEAPRGAFPRAPR
jgi:S-DNA-T family DNA segregation ATPase FtsK/SpoIIIE